MRKTNHRGFLFLTAAMLILLLAGCNKPAASGIPDSVATAADGSPIHYGVKGEGQTTLVFIPCWTCDRSFWKDQIAAFANDYRVVWLELAGHGQSGSQRSTYSMAAFGSDVAAVVEQLDAKRVILVGHSMGGPVAIEAARQLGDRVAGIIGVDTFYTPFPYPRDQAGIDAFVKPFEADFEQATGQLIRAMFLPGADPARVDSLVDYFQATDRQMAMSALYQLFDWRMTRETASLARFDPVLRNINAAPTGKEKPLHEGVIMIPRVGHFIPQMRPRAFNRALQSLVVELAAAK